MAWNIVNWVCRFDPEFLLIVYNVLLIIQILGLRLIKKWGLPFLWVILWAAGIASVTISASSVWLFFTGLGGIEGLLSWFALPIFLITTGLIIAATFSKKKPTEETVDEQ